MPVIAALDYRFKNQKLAEQALTHRSYSADNNERLEFLGDGVLNCVVAELLYRRFSSLPEGDLSRLRAQLVRQETLHALALELELGKHLKLGDGELRSGGRERPSMLADALEALLGAIYLDGGFEAARAVIAARYEHLLNALNPGKALKDPKTRLQEWLQARKKQVPTYTLVETKGLAHAQEFLVACQIAAPRMQAEGHGASRRAAEQDAAAKLLEMLEQ